MLLLVQDQIAVLLQNTRELSACGIDRLIELESLPSAEAVSYPILSNLCKKRRTAGAANALQVSETVQHSRASAARPRARHHGRIGAR